MCKAWEDQKNEGIEIGIEQGIEQGIEIIIGNMLRKNKSYEDIAEVTELSLDEIKRIEEKLLVTI